MRRSVSILRTENLEINNVDYEKMIFGRARGRGGPVAGRTVMRLLHEAVTG
jgi:hypothetical protein